MEPTKTYLVATDFSTPSRYAVERSAQLAEADQARWEAHRAARLFEGAGGARTVELLFTEIDQLSGTADERAESILGALYDWAEAIAPER